MDDTTLSEVIYVTNHVSGNCIGNGQNTVNNIIRFTENKQMKFCLMLSVASYANYSHRGEQAESLLSGVICARMSADFRCGRHVESNQTRGN